MAQESWKRDKEETGCQPPEGPVLCTNGCGFFGSAATTNLCSKCYRDLVSKQAKATSAKAAAEKAFLTTSASDFAVERTEDHLQSGGKAAAVDALPATAAPCVSGGASSTTGGGTVAVASRGAAEGQEPVGPPPPNRCFSCRRKVGLTGFKCRCGNTFCASHRYSDKHTCSFDYKTAGRDAIAKANPVVKADKVDKI